MDHANQPSKSRHSALRDTTGQAAKRANRSPPQPNALAFRIPEVAMVGGPGRTKTYQLVAEGKLRLIKVGGRSLIDGDSLRVLLRDGCE